MYFNHYFKRISCFGWGLLIGTTLFAQSNPGPQLSLSEIMDRLQSNVVHLHKKIQNDPLNGYGFIIGESQEELYIATANHVLIPEAVDAGPLVGQFLKQPLELTFANGAKGTASYVNRSKALDLAVVKVARPPGFQWQRKCLAPTAKIQRNLAVSFYGENADEPDQVNFHSMAVQDEGAITKSSVIEQLISAKLREVKTGNSGGPIVSPVGIVGMIIKFDRQRQVADITHLEAIKATVESWAVPFELVEVPKIPEKVPVSLPKPARISLKVAGGAAIGGGVVLIAKSWLDYQNYQLYLLEDHPFYGTLGRQQYLNQLNQRNGLGIGLAVVGGLLFVSSKKTLYRRKPRASDIDRLFAQLDPFAVQPPAQPWLSPIMGPTLTLTF